MAARVAIDVVPEAARPTEVASVLAEAVELRDRLRQAREELAAAQAELEHQEQADVAAAAQRIRQGAAPGNLSAGITKQRHAVEVAQRNAAALALASDAAQADLAETMLAHADEWIEQLERETAQARERAVEAVATFVRNTDEMNSAAGSAAWLASGRADGRWDRRVPVMVAGTVAVSSRSRTANNEPLRVDELVGYLREALEPATERLAEHDQETQHLHVLGAEREAS
jgi:hypothetical protein